MKAVCKSIALSGLTLAALGGCDQPKPNCLTSQNPFVFKLTPVSKSETLPGACDAARATLSSFYDDPHVGLSPYYERDKKGQPDYRKGSVAIRTAEFANLVAAAEAHEVEPMAGTVLHSLGVFTTEEPDGDDVCNAPMLSDTRLVLPEVPPVPDDPATTMEDESFDGQPAYDVTRKWSELKVYVTADSFGTQVAAKLQDQWVAPNGGGTCSISYDALGLSPAVSCQKLDPKTEKPLTNPDGTFQLDETLCDPEANPSLGRFSGSGIGPSARTVCDPVIGYCVLQGTVAEFPVLK